PRDAYAQSLDLWRIARGSDNGVVLQYGDALTGAQWQRAIDVSSYADALRITGGGSGTQPKPVELEAGGLGSMPQGRWDADWSTQENDQVRLQARGILQLHTAQQLTPSYTIPLQPGVWQGPEHIWIGDTVTVVPNSGRLQAPERLRVLELAVTLGQD